MKKRKKYRKLQKILFELFFAFLAGKKREFEKVIHMKEISFIASSLITFINSNNILIADKHIIRDARFFRDDTIFILLL